jgi:tRNA(Ile)-lysidine synthase TilS/MesJ
MAGSQPPRAAVRAAVRACLADLEPGERVIVALSGGADSLALTAAVVVVGAELGLLCEAVVVDHQLQAGSAQVAARAAEQARILGCAAQVVAVTVLRGAGSGGVEAAARAARYAALDAVAGVGGGAPRAPAAVSVPVAVVPPGAAFPEGPSPDGASLGAAAPDEAAATAQAAGAHPVPRAAAVLLGHTREDQAETVLLGLARGSGTRSLAGMARHSGVYRRPLLDLPRDVVVAAAVEAASADPRLKPWADPHNDDSGFTRVRVRRDVLPLLEGALGPGVVEALARTAALAREDADALDAWADQVWAQVLDSSTTAEAQQSPAPAPPRSAPKGFVAAGSGQGPQTAPAPRSVPAPDDPCGLWTLEGSEPARITEQAPPEARPAPPAGSAAATVTDRSRTRVPPSLPVAGLTALPPAIVNRVVRRLLVEAGCPTGSLTAGHIRAVAALLDHGASARAEVALPGGRRARREAGALVVRV